MKTSSIDSALEAIKRNSNEVYYNHKKDVVDLILSFKTYDECWSGLRRWDALTLFRKERHLFNQISNFNKEIGQAIIDLAEDALGSI